MYYVNKIVGWCLSPIGMLFLGFAVGMGLRSARCLRCLRGVRGLRCLGNWVIGATLVTFWFFGTGIATRVIGVPLEGEETPEAGTLQVGGYDAIVLLGGGMGAHEKCGRAEMFQGADRVWHAAKLWKAYHVEGDGMKMTLSGGRTAKSTIPLLRDFGVEGDVFLMFEEARNTEEEAQMIAAAGIKRILLVTSAWHMPRARILFERAGLEVVSAPCDYEMHYVAEEPLQIKDFFPSADAMMRNSSAVKEWVARFLYWIKR